MSTSIDKFTVWSHTRRKGGLKLTIEETGGLKNRTTFSGKRSYNNEQEKERVKVCRRGRVCGRRDSTKRVEGI